MKKYLLILFVLGLTLTGCITQPENKENATGNITAQNETQVNETESDNLIYVEPSEIGLSDVFGKKIYGYSLMLTSTKNELVFEGSGPFSDDEVDQLDEQLKLKFNKTVRAARYSKNETFSNFLKLKKMNYTNLNLPEPLRTLFDAIRPEEECEFILLNHGNNKNRIFPVSENWFESEPAYLQNYTDAFVVAYRIRKNFTNESAFSMFDEFLNKTDAEKTEEYAVFLNAAESLNFTTYVSHFAYVGYNGLLVIETNSEDDRVQITMQVVKFE